MKLLIKQLTIILALLNLVLSLPALANQQVNNPCIQGSGTCSADINEVIVAGKGLENLVWVGTNIKAGSSYVCNVVYLNPQNQGFIAQSGYWGELQAPVNLIMGTWFYVTATQNHHVGFQVDGTYASGPSGYTNGPQVSLVCYG